MQRGNVREISSKGDEIQLLARAVAGKADVPFFSISASEFIEAIVGVGASRVRDLFSQAKAAAPAIIFVEELDSIGRSGRRRRRGRSSGTVASGTTCRLAGWS